MRRTEDPRITAIREQIEKETLGQRGGYSNWSHMQHTRLNKKLNELLSTPSLQLYHDRSRGGIEVLRGLDAVARIMAEKIHEVVNGSIAQ